MRHCLFLLGLVSFGVAATTATQGLGADAAIPRAEMQRMASGLGHLLPLALGDAAIESKKQRDALKTELSEMAYAARRVEGALPQTANDPIMKLLPLKLEAAFLAAKHDLDAGRDGSFKARIQRTTAICIGCHTRMPGGVASVHIASDFPIGMTYERAEFLAATRQFPTAMAQFEKVLNDPAFAREHPAQWSKAVRKLIAVGIRVENRPRLALEFLSKIRDAKTTPTPLQRAAAVWRLALKEWLAEPATQSAVTLEAVKRLYQAGDDRVVKTGDSDAGMIEFLRASAMAHELLQVDDGTAAFGEQLFFAGLISEKLGELSLGLLPEMYFEACIRRVPHTGVSTRCFARYKDRAVPAGLTDFGKVAYPDDAIDRYNELAMLAK